MNPAPNLVLVGPMGAGKTTIGKRLASELSLTFVDVDERLEQIAGATVPMIFEHEGEPGFRARESRLLDELMQGRDQVIATGGGAILMESNRHCLSTRGFVVYIRVGVGQQLSRLARDHARPLLAGTDRRATLQALAESRNPLYESVADAIVDTDGNSVSRAALRILSVLQAQWQRGAPA